MTMDGSNTFLVSSQKNSKSSCMVGTCFNTHPDSVGQLTQHFTTYTPGGKFDEHGIVAANERYVGLHFQGINKIRRERA